MQLSLDGCWFRRRLGAAGALLVLVLAALAEQAPAAVTIGSDLSSVSGQSTCGGPTPEACTAVQTALPGRPITAPTAGVVVRWRVRDSAGLLALRIARPAGPGTFTGVGTSAAVVVTAPAQTFDTRLPIAAGDHIGINLDPSAALGYRLAAGAEELVFFPPLGDGETRAGQFTNADVENLVNVDIEPDADRDNFGDETQDRCSKDAATQGLCTGACSNDRSGTEGDDTLTGTDAGDKLLALGGNDTVTALNGDDCVEAGAGADRVTGDAGVDQLNGQAGADTLTGGVGNDRLLGELDADALDGGEGDDVLTGDAGNDRLSGVSGRDVLDGGSGNDVVVAGSGDDRVGGGSGNDRVDGGSGNDRIVGGAGNDRIVGGAGNDRIDGGAGKDRIDVGSGGNRASGGAGRDDIRAANGRRDRISCGSGRDKVRADTRDRIASNCERVTFRR